MSHALHSPRIAVHHVTHLYACTRENVEFLIWIFSNFVTLNWLENGEKYFPRGGPSGWNSLCKNRKKWEKNPIKCGFLSFFVKNGSIFYLNFKVKIADFHQFWAIFRYFLWIFINFELFSLNFHQKWAIFELFSGKISIICIRGYSGIDQDFDWFSLIFSQI